MGSARHPLAPFSKHKTLPGSMQWPPHQSCRLCPHHLLQQLPDLMAGTKSRYLRPPCSPAVLISCVLVSMRKCVVYAPVLTGLVCQPCVWFTECMFIAQARVICPIWTWITCLQGQGGYAHKPSGSSTSAKTEYSVHHYPDTPLPPPPPLQ